MCSATSILVLFNIYGCLISEAKHFKISLSGEKHWNQFTSMGISNHCYILNCCKARERKQNLSLSQNIWGKSHPEMSWNEYVKWISCKTSVSWRDDWWTFESFHSCWSKSRRSKVMGKHERLRRYPSNGKQRSQQDKEVCNIYYILSLQTMS